MSCIDHQTWKETNEFHFEAFNLMNYRLNLIQTLTDRWVKAKKVFWTHPLIARHWKATGQVHSLVTGTARKWERLWCRSNRVQQQTNKLTWYIFMCLFGPSLCAWNNNMIYHQHLDRTCAHTHTHTHTRVQRVIGAMAAFLCCSYYLRISFLKKEKKRSLSHKKKSSFPWKLFWKVFF